VAKREYILPPYTGPGDPQSPVPVPENFTEEMRQLMQMTGDAYRKGYEDGARDERNHVIASAFHCSADRKVCLIPYPGDGAECLLPSDE
jgi:hypothetical protein